jgi:ribosomal protein L37AE/L43A
MRDAILHNGRMAKTVAIRCPGCGASSFHKASRGVRTCKYCGTKFRIESPRSSNPRPVLTQRGNTQTTNQGPIPARQGPMGAFHNTGGGFQGRRNSFPGHIDRRTPMGRVIHGVWIAVVAIIMVIFLITFLDTKSQVDKGFQDAERDRSQWEADRERHREEFERTRRTMPGHDPNRLPPYRD